MLRTHSGIGFNPDDLNLYILFKIKLPTKQILKINAGVNRIYYHTVIRGTDVQQNDFGSHSLNYTHITVGR